MTLLDGPIVAAPTKRLTVEEFERLPDSERYELVHGVLEELHMGAESDDIAFLIAMALRQYTQAHGGTATGHTTFAYDPDDPNHLRKPDAAYFAPGRLPGDRFPFGHVRVAPDIAIEAVSPHDVTYQLEEKIAEYFAFGTRRVWLAFPRQRAIRVHRPDGTSVTFTAGQTLADEELLPGFALDVASVFPRP